MRQVAIVIPSALPSPERRHVACLVIPLVLFAGCAHKIAAPPAAPPVIHATPVVITPHDDEAPTAKFERARLLLLDGKGAEAGELFDQLAAGDAASEVTPFAHFNSGVAWETAGDRQGALVRFRAVADRFEPSQIGKWGALRETRLEAYLEQWSQLSASADRLLGRADLTDSERLEANGAKALAVVEAGDPDGAERFVSRARDLIESQHIGDGGKIPIEVAQVYFALGEIRRQRSEAVTFSPVPANFAGALEQRCQGLLDAQSAYSDAMRSYDAHWSAMSGYRVGELYQKLHHDVLAIPPPASATTADKKRLFDGAMGLRYRILLEKGLKMMDHTVMVGDRTGEASHWIERAREAKRDLERALEEEKAKLDKLPYTEKDLQKAFDDLAKKPRTP